jgi:seryl-tRNA synthetase
MFNEREKSYNYCIKKHSQYICESSKKNMEIQRIKKQGVYDRYQELSKQTELIESKIQEIEKNIQQYNLEINQLTSERLMISEKITNLSQYKMVHFWQPAEN